jgi:uncharacterized membrane protein YdcZ (DUF606 family)
VILRVQAGVNAQLRATLGSPLFAAVVAGQMLTSVVLDSTVSSAIPRTR